MYSPSAYRVQLRAALRHRHEAIVYQTPVLPLIRQDRERITQLE